MRIHRLDHVAAPRGICNDSAAKICSSSELPGGQVAGVHRQAESHACGAQHLAGQLPRVAVDGELRDAVRGEQLVQLLLLTAHGSGFGRRP